MPSRRRLLSYRRCRTRSPSYSVCSNLQPSCHRNMDRITEPFVQRRLECSWEQYILGRHQGCQLEFGSLQVVHSHLSSGLYIYPHVTHSTVLNFELLNWLMTAQVQYPPIFNILKCSNGTFNRRDLSMCFYRTDQRALRQCLTDIITIGFINSQSVVALLWTLSFTSPLSSSSVWSASVSSQPSCLHGSFCGQLHMGCCIQSLLRSSAEPQK